MFLRKAAFAAFTLVCAHASLMAAPVGSNPTAATQTHVPEQAELNAKLAALPSGKQELARQSLRFSILGTRPDGSSVVSTDSDVAQIQAFYPDAQNTCIGYVLDMLGTGNASTPEGVAGMLQNCMTQNAQANKVRLVFRVVPPVS